MILATQWPLYAIYKKEQDLEERVAELEDELDEALDRLEAAHQFVDAGKMVDELEGGAEK
jgi:cell division septum initiation protein DivIVA